MVVNWMDATQAQKCPARRTPAPMPRAQSFRDRRAPARKLPLTRRMRPMNPTEKRRRQASDDQSRGSGETNQGPGKGDRRNGPEEGQARRKRGARRWEEVSASRLMGNESTGYSYGVTAAAQPSPRMPRKLRARLFAAAGGSPKFLI